METTSSTMFKKT